MNSTEDEEVRGSSEYYRLEKWNTYLTFREIWIKFHQMKNLFRIWRSYYHQPISSFNWRSQILKAFSNDYCSLKNRYMCSSGSGCQATARISSCADWNSIQQLRHSHEASAPESTEQMSKLRDVYKAERITPLKGFADSTLKENQELELVGLFEIRS